MAKYKVIGQAVEIDGKIRQIGEILTDKEFRPANPKELQRPRHPGTPNREPSDPCLPEEEEKGEAESLLGSGHIEIVK